MRTGRGGVEMAKLSIWIEQHRSSRGFHLCQIGILFAVDYVTLLAGSGRYDRQPHHAALGPIMLQALHVAAAIVLLGEWAIPVGPLEHHVLAFKVGKVVGLVVGVGRGKRWRGLAYTSGPNLGDSA